MYQLIIWICGKLWNHGNWVDPFFDMAAMRLELQPWILDSKPARNQWFFQD